MGGCHPAGGWVHGAMQVPSRLRKLMNVLLVPSGSTQPIPPRAAHPDVSVPTSFCSSPCSHQAGMFVHVAFDAMGRGYSSQHNTLGMIGAWPCVSEGVQRCGGWGGCVCECARLVHGEYCKCQPFSPPTHHLIWLPRALPHSAANDTGREEADTSIMLRPPSLNPTLHPTPPLYPAVNYTGREEADTFIMRQAREYIGQGVQHVSLKVSGGAARRSTELVWGPVALLLSWRQKHHVSPPSPNRPTPKLRW